jgi:hypothetical protein
MANYKAFTLSENDNPLNQAALEWLTEAKADTDRYYLYLLQLASWGLDDGSEGDWPARHRYALREQVNLLFGWKPADVLAWLLSNPNCGEDPEDQEADLLRLLETTDNPWRAAAHVLNAIYSRQVSQCPALQPATDRS